MKDRITKEKRKSLKKRLIQSAGNSIKAVKVIAFLSWIQFILRIISFAMIAYCLEAIFKQKNINIQLFLLVGSFLAIFAYLISTLSKKYQGVTSRYARNKIKTDFFNTFMSNYGEFDDNYSIADTLNVASQGIDVLDTFYSHVLGLNYRVYFNCTSVLLLVLWVYPLAALVFILALPLIPVSIMLIQKRSKKIMNHYWSTYMDVGNMFMDNLKGINTLYSYQADQKFENNFVRKAEEFRLSTMELLKFQLQSVGYMDAVMYLGLGVSGFLVANAYINQNISLFSLIFFILIGIEFFTPIREVGYGMHLLMMNIKMADRIFSFLDDHKNIVKTSNMIKEINHITFENVSFNYQDKCILNDVSFNLEKSKLIALAGLSGSGKTTISKLLFKNLNVQEGKILIDKYNINEIEKNEINQHFILINSESYLFNQSIKDNLLFGTDLSFDEIKIWLKENKILSFIENLKDGFETIVGENAKLLSNGQRQQIICVRAFLSKKKVFVFDEITSSVDKENEKEIFNLIKLMKKDAIILFISHKMQQVMEADEVLFINQKQLIQSTPKLLYQENIAFKKLYDTQKSLQEVINETR